VRAAFEHHDLRAGDALVQPRSEPRGGEACWRPNVIWVGALILPSCASASCPITASDCRRKASTGCRGLWRTNPASEAMYSGFAAYSSGVKHQGKMPRMISARACENVAALQ